MARLEKPKPKHRAHFDVGRLCAGIFLQTAWVLCCGIHPRQAAAEARAEFVQNQIQQRNAHLPPALQTEKYNLMAETIFSFFRATNHLFWADYGNSPLLAPFGGPTTRIWIQGDAHCENVSALLTNQNQVVLDLDDFDETLIADYQLDLWRMAVSLLLAIQENGGLPQKTQEQLIDAFAASYLDTLRAHRDNESELLKRYAAQNTVGFLSDWMSQLSEATHARVLKKMTTLATGKRKFNFDKPDVQPVSVSVLHALQGAWPGYQATLSGRLRNIPGYFQIKDVAQKVRGGMGSMGVTRFFILIEGVSPSQDDDRVLDVKAQTAPAGWLFVDPATREQLSSFMGQDHALRVVLGYRTMGYRADEHLGSLHALGEHFFVRERTPVRTPIELHNLVNPQRSQHLAQQWGAVLATAHARADQDSSPLVSIDFEKEVLAKVATEKQRQAFLLRVRQVAFFYARQVSEDYRAFKDARPVTKKTPS